MRDLSKSLPPLVLASGSPRRAQLLREMGIDFKVIPSSIPEIHHDQLTAQELAQINAYRKARSIAKKSPQSLVLGADTLVCIESRILGKPASLEEAYRMLEMLSGRAHTVITAVCLLRLRPHSQKVFADTTQVRLRSLDAVAIRRYLNEVDPLDKAGAYAIQEHGDTIVEQILGSYSNVVGLPVEKLTAELERWSGAAPWIQTAPSAGGWPLPAPIAPSAPI